MPRIEYDFGSPRKTQQAYERGLVGCIPDPSGWVAVKAASRRRFGTAPLRSLAGLHEGKLVLLHAATLKFDPKAYDEAQRTGDCVSHQLRNCLQTLASVEVAVKREREVVPKRFATEPFYGARGHGGQGASCPRLAGWASTKGGVLLRQEYKDLGIDLSEYNPQVGIKWGRSGVPREVEAEAAKHQVQSVTYPKRLEESLDAMAAGYPVGTCGPLSFSAKRDKNGVSSRTRGGWAHSMSWSGFDARPETLEVVGDFVVFVNQSWGKWSSGGWPDDYGPAPPGIFGIRGADARKYQQIVYSNFDGWPAQKLPDYIFG